MSDEWLKKKSTCPNLSFRQFVLNSQTDSLNFIDMERITALLTSLGYSSGFLKERMENIHMVNGIETFCLKNDLNDPFIVFISNSTINEEVVEGVVLSGHPTIGMIVFYTSSKVYKISVRNFNSDTFSSITELESPKFIQQSKSILFGDPSKGYRALQPLSDVIENLFFEAHSLIRDIDGLHPDEALDEICKFIYTKLYDEENNSGDKKYLQKSIYSTMEEAASIARSLYKESTEYDERVFSLRIPKYKKSRGVFSSNIQLSSPSLYRLICLFEDIDLTNSKMDVKGRAFQKMLLPTMRAGMGQYFTPLPIISFIVKILSPTIDDLVIDPFCGSGHFLSESLRYVIDSNSGAIHEKKIHEFKFHKLHGIEKSERMVRISMTDMRLLGDGHSNIRCTDALLNFDNYEDLKEGSFDLVMSNPPFGSILSSEALDRLGEFELKKGRKTIPLEIIGLERCIQLLRPGGRFGIVLPESVLTNKNTKYVREWLLKNTCLFGIVSLPLETFAPFGANIKTVILFGKKRRMGELKNDSNNCVIGKINSVGYDFKGKVTANNDIDLLITPLKQTYEEL